MSPVPSIRYVRTIEGMAAVGKSLINGLVRTGDLETEGREWIWRVPGR